MQFSVCRSQSKLGNFMCKGKGVPWKYKSSSVMPNGPCGSQWARSQRPGCWSETKCWLRADQNSALEAKNKAQRSCSFFKPLLSFPWSGEYILTWNRSRPEAATLDGHWALHQCACFLTWLSANPVQTFSIPWLKPHTEAIRWRWPQMYFLTLRRTVGEVR